MEDHETRRKILRQWRSLPKDKRQTAEQAAAFARKAMEENELQRSRRAPYERVLGWLLPRIVGSGVARRSSAPAQHRTAGGQHGFLSSVMAVLLDLPHGETLCVSKTRDRVMSPSGEDKLIPLLTEI